MDLITTTTYRCGGYYKADHCTSYMPGPMLWVIIVLGIAYAVFHVWTRNRQQLVDLHAQGKAGITLLFKKWPWLMWPGAAFLLLSVLFELGLMK